VHKSLVLYKVPTLYLNARLKRRTTWLDETESADLHRQPSRTSGTAPAVEIPH
jgi:hypothetical protein